MLRRAFGCVRLGFLWGGLCCRWCGVFRCRGSLGYGASPEFVAAHFDVHLDVVGVELACAEALGEGASRAVEAGGEEGYVAQADVALERAGHPGADASLLGVADPLDGACDAAV